MTLNGVITVILRYFTECVSFIKAHYVKLGLCRLCDEMYYKESTGWPKMAQFFCTPYFIKY